MKSVGVICECNPMHGGHQYLIERARKNGAERVICLMSGCFVQRGEAAIADPYLRAEALLRGGADVVLELPFPYAAAGAEFFAAAGVEILDRLGVNELWFGSECGDLQRLEAAAEICDSDDFRAQYAKTVSDTDGTAQAYFDILRRFCGEDVPISPNDILGISYLRAIRKRSTKLLPVTVKREGSAYTEEFLNTECYPSATALRKKWREAGVGSILPYLPAACREVYARAGEPIDLKHAERLILGHFRLTPLAELEQIAALSGGLGNRMHRASCEAATLEEFFDLVATKKYPTARLRRGVLFALTGIFPEDLRTSPAYVRLLAANGAGCGFLADCRRGSELPIVTRKIDLPATPEAELQAEWERRAWALYGLCMPNGRLLPSPWKRNPLIED